ncbi:MAG TPA: YtxH domain-containing protein [Gemmatimonadales bacterium]|nr:YtxH domain-containing protein [Gemmatimonadales bacterium]
MSVRDQMAGAGERRVRQKVQRVGAGAGVLLGVLAAGVAAGMLTAPRSGSKTRRRLRKRLAGLAGGRAARLAALGSVGVRAGRRLRGRWEDLGDALEQHRRRIREGGEKWLEELEERVSALEEQVEETGERIEEGEDPAEAIEEVIEEQRGGTRWGRALGFALGAGLTYFLVSERTADARTRVQEVAERARRRAGDEWDRFQREGGFQRFTGKNGGVGEESETSTARGASEPA